MHIARILSGPADLHKALKRLEFRKRHHRDAVIICAVAVAVYAVALALDLPVYIDALPAGFWFVDAGLLLSLIVAVGATIYAYRRIHDINREVAARRQAVSQAHTFARHDPLTGLPNRGYFTERLQAIVHRLPEGKFAAVVMFEVHGLRAINDARGHLSGDRALIDIAEGLSAIMEPDTVFARIGGDDFAIVQPSIDSIDETVRLARVIAAAIGRACFDGDAAGTLGACVGAAVAPDDGVNAEILLRRADLALSRAKQTGRSTVCFYKTEMDAQVERRAEIERALRVELPKNVIVPHYQPLVSLEGNRIIGFEALARWHSAEVGHVTPDVFISIAEENGLIQDLGDRLLRQACRDAVGWPDDIILAFNLSPRQLQDPSLALRILNVLQETGLPPRRLEIEITETALVGDVTLARKIIEELRAVGVRTALDDFGTGYATLSQLVAFNFDKIKIDRSFIRRLGKDSESDVIVKAVLGLARGLGLTSLAEGIEDAGQHGDLLAAGCMQGQGYLFGKAMPAEEATALVYTPHRAVA